MKKKRSPEKGGGLGGGGGGEGERLSHNDIRTCGNQSVANPKNSRNFFWSKFSF